MTLVKPDAKPAELDDASQLSMRIIAMSIPHPRNTCHHGGFHTVAGRNENLFANANNESETITPTQSEICGINADDNPGWWRIFLKDVEPTNANFI